MMTPQFDWVWRNDNRFSMEREKVARSLTRA